MVQIPSPAAPESIELPAAAANVSVFTTTPARLMVGINYNQDVGDSWEHADDSFYPQPMTAQGYRFGVNYVTYAMTH